MSSSISLLRAPAPAATARRGAALEGPLEPKSPPDSSGPKLPPPPPAPLRPSSMVSVELKPCSTTSVEYFSTPALVGPFAGLQRAFDVNLGALLQILLDDLAERLGEDHHAVPLGFFLALAGGLVAPGLGGRHAQIGDRPPVLGPPDFRILAEISDQNHLVYASRHRRSPLLECTELSGSVGRRPRIPGLPSGPLRTTLKPDPIRSPQPRALRSPCDPRLSTYSIAAGNVPVLFRAMQPSHRYSVLRSNAKPVAKVRRIPGSRNSLNKSLTCHNSLRRRVLHFGDGIFGESQYGHFRIEIDSALAPKIQTASGPKEADKNWRRLR